MTGVLGGRIRRLLLWLGLSAAGLWLLAAWFAAREISQPTRRALEPHHLALLSVPDAHGNVLITSYPLYADMAAWMIAHARPVTR